MSPGHFCFHRFGDQGFNDGLEELCKIQKAWAIPDTEQRDKIRQAQKNIVKETYGAFLHRLALRLCPPSPTLPVAPAGPLGPSLLQGNLERVVGLGGRYSAHGFGVGPDPAITQGHPIGRALG